jgi:O-antigen ligase
MDVADGLAVALVASLPWSTSATGILAALWFLAVIPALDPWAVWRILRTPAGGLPILLWALGVVGMLWAIDVPFMERVNGLSSFHKLLFIPLLMAQFERSERASWVLYSYVVSCTALLVVSWFLVLAPGLSWRGKATVGVPVKDYISQSLAFVICAFLLAALAVEAWRRGWRQAAMVSYILTFIFLANVIYVSTSRTALAVIPILAFLFAITRLSWTGAATFVALSVLFAGLGWSTAHTLRKNVEGLSAEVVQFDPEGVSTRAGERLEFWRKSISFVVSSPLVGHGTGSILQQFRNASAGQHGMAGLASANPHNQVLAVGIQLGMLGTIVMLAMWAMHAMLFRAVELVAWAGLVIVTQNFVGSLFNSHLFDFTQGWSYVIGVGVAAGVVRRQVLRRPAPDQ